MVDFASIFGPRPPIMVECTACIESKPITDFQRDTLTDRCKHEATLCQECITLSLASQAKNNAMDEITCPECPERLTFDEIQKFASPEIFEKYHQFSVTQLITKITNFIWCPLGCGTGMVRNAGQQLTITLCLTCNKQFCARHLVAWHTDYTCDEYDQYLADPENFQSAAIRERQHNERVAQRLAVIEARFDDQIRAAEDRFALRLQNAEAAAVRAKAAEQERQERERREREERKRVARQRRREREEREARELAERKRKEEAETAAAIPTLSKPCPNCKVAIQKNLGCQHMTCTQCGHHWHWDTGDNWF